MVYKLITDRKRPLLARDVHIDRYLDSIGILTIMRLKNLLRILYVVYRQSRAK